MYHPAYYEPLSTWAFQCSSDCSISITVYCDGTRPGDPVAFLIVIPVLVASSVIASLLPARRASRIDPVRALRQE